MIANISYKLSLFADYTNISYSRDNILKVIGAFKDLNLLPGVVNEALANGGISQRIQLTSANGAVVISILSTRIDVEIVSLNKEGFSCEERKKRFPDLSAWIKIIYEVFSDIIPEANRLAWFVSYVNFEISPEEKKKFRNSFIKELPFYSSNSTDEFMVRYAGREQSEINKVMEQINIISTISKWISGSGTEVEFDGYKIDFDINTWQENRKNRFIGNSVDEFVNIAQEYQEKLEADFINEYK